MYSVRLRVSDRVADKVRWFLGNLPSDDVEIIEDDILVDTTGTSNHPLPESFFEPIIIPS